MARSRKMPPLFEVMRETDRKAEGAPETPAPTPPTAPLPRRAVTESKPLRLGPTPSHAPTPEAPETVMEGPPGKGLVLPWPVVLGGVGVLIAIIAVIAMLAFNAGAKRELNELLPKDGQPPPVTGTPRSNDPQQPTDPLVPGGGTPSGSDANGPPTGAARTSTVSPDEVFGDDPREAGKNYLIIERLMFDDAMAAAAFLTENGVPSVVVPPEGVESSDLQRQARGIWLLIARQGFTRDEYRASSEAEDIKNAVIRLGRRWKQDHKGTTNFANCYWNKFGK